MPDPWLILASGGGGAISSHTTRNDLVRMYGAANVIDQDADVGDGEIQPETVLFPKDSERRIEILWRNPDRRANPASASIRGDKSRWHGAHGVSLGMTSSELERINGRPFRLTLLHDGTDMAEEQISWRGGLLEKEFQGEGHVTLWLIRSATNVTKRMRPEDFGFDSNDPMMRSQNFHTTEMTWVFPSTTQPDRNRSARP
jgi:hypothetical protein